MRLTHIKNYYLCIVRLSEMGIFSIKQELCSAIALLLARSGETWGIFTYFNSSIRSTKMTVFPVIDFLRAWHKRSRISYQLGRMSDRDLADIGITRGDIDAVVRGRFSRDDSRRR